MKKFYFLLMLTVILIGCNNSKKTEVSNDISEEPSGVVENENENGKLTLLNYIKANNYNPHGYYLLVEETDEYGKPKLEKHTCTMIFSENVVNELKKYNTVEDFWYSDYGSKIIDKIIDCVHKDINSAQKVE